MTSERWKQIEQIFYQALNLSETERNKFMKIACGGDMELQNEVKSLLQQDNETGTMLKTLISKAAGSLPYDEIPDLAGKRIGPYRISGLIGQGGMAEVHKAVRADDQYQKLVAIKIIRQDSSPTFLVSRFWYERQILANMEHPCIARFLEGGTTEEGIAYLVMEYVEGETITEYCEKKQLTIRNRLELFRSVCDAVQYAHRNLVIHRDLKPSNILVTSDGVPKLLDFGIAKLVNAELISDVPSETITSISLMTPEYASPEQVRGEQITTATDIYSLGVVLYELLTGERPQQFKTKSFSEIERVVCEQDPERPSSAVMRSQSTTGQIVTKRDDRRKLRREFARELDNIVMMAMQKDRQRRYLTVAQFNDDIYRYLDGLPIRARTQTLSYRALKFARRHRTAVALATFAILVLAVFSAVMTFQASRIAKERDRANQVTEFLVELFEVSDPGESRGNTVTARELLNAGSQKIQRDLRKQPEVQAALMDTMGRVYGNLGLYSTAIPLLQKSLEIRKHILGKENPDVASTMTNLGDALQNGGKYADAEPLVRKALAVRQKLLGNNHPDVAASLTSLNTILYETGRYDEAESSGREALRINRKTFGEEHVNVANSLTIIADVHIIQGKIDKAESLYRQALAMRRKLLGNNHPDVSTSLHNLGRTLQFKGDYDGAELVFREVIELDRKFIGKDHPDAAIVMASLARILMKKKEYPEAEKLFRDSLALSRKALGDQHPDVGLCIYNLAALLTEKGDYDSAESLFQEAQLLWKKTLPPLHRSHVLVVFAQGRVYMKRGKQTEAESLFKEALEMGTRVMPSDHHDIGYFKSTMGECLTLQGRYNEAEVMLLDSYRILKKQSGLNHPDTIASAERLVSLYNSWEKPVEAARYQQPTKIKVIP